MEIGVTAAPWTKLEVHPAFEDLPRTLRGVWPRAASEFAAKRAAADNTGTRGPKGIQRELNAKLDEALVNAGWDGEKGRYIKDDAWLRITFRHSMSQGSDVLEAIRMCKVEGIGQAMIASAPRDFLRIISPNDAGALCSYERLSSLVKSLDGALDIPLLVGKLEPVSALDPEISQVVFGARPRDTTVPS